MRSIRTGTFTWYRLAQAAIASSWALLPSTTANQGRACPGSRRRASANPSAMTRGIGCLAEANRVLPAAFGPWRARAASRSSPPAGRDVPKRAVMMSPAVRGAGATVSHQHALLQPAGCPMKP